MDARLKIAKLTTTRGIAHFTVAGENEAGVDLVLIQPLTSCFIT